MRRMFEKTEVCEQTGQNDEMKEREKIEAALLKLQTLKSRISELRLQCEQLQKQKLKDEDKEVVCDECGKEIESGQEVRVKASAGSKDRYYHKECFQALWG